MALSKWSRRRIRRASHPRTCPGKIKMLTQRTAEAQAQRQSKRLGDMTAYKCRACGFWHIGHAEHANKPE